MPLIPISAEQKGELDRLCQWHNDLSARGIIVRSLRLPREMKAFWSDSDDRFSAYMFKDIPVTFRDA